MEVAIHNPNDKPVDDLPIIFGFNNGGGNGTYYAQLIAEDGTPLGSHICSNESFMLGDLGILKGSRSDRHEGFQKHYPDGYKMEFVSHKDVPSHTKLQESFRLNKEIKPKKPTEITEPCVVIEVEE